MSNHINLNRLLFLLGTALVTASEEEDNTPEKPAGTPAADGGEEAPKRRGRPPGSTNAKPAEPAATPAPEKATPAAPAEETGEERLAKNKEIIAPYVEAQKGEEVKKIIAKYSPTGLKDLMPEQREAFKKDLAVLDY